MPTTDSPQLRELVAAFDGERPLASAETPPSAWYTDADLYALEKRSVFERSWQYVGLVDWVKEVGQYFAVDLGHEPVLIARTSDGIVALSNVCRHRGGPLVREGTGRATSWSCLYHGWNYALDGRLRKAPEFEDVAGFDRACVRLPRWRVAQMGPFLFVCASEDTEPLDAFAPGLTDLITELRPEQLVHAERRVYSVACNWKVFVDNYLDGGYHVPVLHPGLSGSLDYARYHCTLHEGWNLQHAPMRPGEAGEVRSGEAAHYIWAWPNWMFNAYEGVLDINWVRPRGVARCEVIFDYFFAPGTEEAFIKDSLRIAEQVQEEDREICEAVQRGLESSHYDVGRYSVRRENGDHQFHQLLARALRKGLDD
ncbi:MAG: aromatic ring-hydroxylating dioxygenase subunit alpha [Planctomycetota bacterium]